ncbi:MAG: EF-P beta-lysylation protein EpmB, partial [Pseudomonadales bacterium]
MIPQTKALRQAEHSHTQPDRIQTGQHHTASWQQLLAGVIRKPEQLFALLELDKAHLPAALTAAIDFPLRAPLPFIQRITKGDWNDPLLRQLLPMGQELDKQPGFSHDPLQEAASNPTPGLIHKYRGRVLLVVSGG